MKDKLDTSNGLINKYLLQNSHDLKGNVATQAFAASSGLDEHAIEVLNYIHGLAPAYEFEPYIVRKNRTNPYEHNDVENISRENSSIQCADHSLPIRIYRPNNFDTAPLPALVYFHGGGFVLGDIESYDKMLAQLCSQAKIAIISVAYRLAPETVFPGAVSDTNETMHWIFSHGAELNINPAKIAIGGDSAGANLATVYCIQNQYEQLCKPCLQLLIYPSIIGNDSSPSREKYSENLLLSKSLLKWFHNHYICKELENDPRFNVLNSHTFEKVPPAFVITGGFDPLRDEGQMYVETLRQSGITVKHSCYTDMFHGFINFGALQQAKDAVSECANLLSNIMR